MDSQDSPHKSYPQHPFNDIEHRNLSDSANTQHASNLSQYHQPTTIPLPNSFIQVDEFANKLSPVNLHFQPTFPCNPNSNPFSSHVQQQLESGISFQGLMNAPNLPFENQTPYSSKGSEKKTLGKASKKTHSTEPTVLHRNWNTDEDIALTKAWLAISVDSIIGNNQKFDKVWNRIFKAWRKNMGDQCDMTRNANALGCRWGVIHGAVTKFLDLYERLECHPRSGTNPEHMKGEAMRMYMDLNEGQPFKFEHCWEIMKNNPKWCTQYLSLGQALKKQKTSNGSSIDTLFPSKSTTSTYSFSHGRFINRDTSVTESITFDEVARPPGRKVCKEKKKRVHGVIDLLSNLQCTIEKQISFNQEVLELKKEKDKKEYELRKQLLKMEIEFKERDQKLKEEAQKRKEKEKKRKNQERLLNQDLNKLQPVLREAFERMQAEILKEWENDGLFGDVSASDDVEHWK